MADEWRETTIGALCDDGVAELQTGPFGSQLHAREYVDSGVPVVPTAAIRRRRIDHDLLPRISPSKADQLSRHRLRCGDILFARRGAQATGQVAIVRAAEEGFISGTGVIRLRVRPGSTIVDADFLSHVLSDPTSVEWFKFHAIGATMPNLNEGIIRSFPLLLPPLQEQRAIANMLGTLDDKIELNRRMSETLEEMARALFESWFVRFDPVRAKMEGRDPGLPSDLADLFPDRLVESELGEIPEGWQVEPFSEIVDVIGGGTPRTSVPEYWGGDIPWFSVGDAPPPSEVWVIDTEKKITPRAIEESSARILPVGTTIISARGTVGRIALVGVPMAMNQSCYGLRGKLGTAGYFTYYATRSLVSTLQQRTHGSVFDTITRDTLASVTSIVPPLHLVDAFEALVGPIFGRILTNLRESRTLAALRDTLLPKLISGELRVKDAERLVAAAT